MQMPKPTDADKDYFRSIVPDAAGVVVKPMFGNLAAFVNDNMFMGLFGSAVGLRLGDGDREELLAQPGAGPFGPADRPMKEYATLPAALRDDPAATSGWVERALERTAALPPKKKKRK